MVNLNHLLSLSAYGDSAANAGAATRATNAMAHARAHNRANSRNPVMANRARTTRMRVEKCSHESKSLGFELLIQPLLGEIVNAVQQGAPSPFTLAEIVNVSRVTFAMLDSAGTGLPVDVAP